MMNRASFSNDVPLTLDVYIRQRILVILYIAHRVHSLKVRSTCGYSAHASNVVYVLDVSSHIPASHSKRSCHLFSLADLSEVRTRFYRNWKNALLTYLKCFHYLCEAKRIINDHCFSFDYNHTAEVSNQTYLYFRIVSLFTELGISALESVCHCRNLGFRTADRWLEALSQFNCPSNETKIVH